jgi:hypothetical protein
LNAAIKAEELRGRICGLLKKIDCSSKGEFDAITDDGLRQFIAEEAEAVNLAMPLAPRPALPG